MKQYNKDGKTFNNNNNNVTDFENKRMSGIKVVKIYPYERM